MSYVETHNFLTLAMPLNLALDPWIPVRRANGAVSTIAPWEVTDARQEGGPIVAFAWPRPDFDAASHEFLIGLLTTAAAPDDDHAWLEWWRAPPSPETLKERLAKIADAFVLDGSGPRFLQDLDPLDEVEPIDVSALLIDTPGENTLKKNADLFVKRGRIAVLSRAAAAMALFTLQTYAPSGGQGHRTSLRGGGPLSTLIVGGHLHRPKSLWDRLWPNVETREAIEERRVGAAQSGEAPIFPWLAPTRISDPNAGGRPTTPGDVDPLQVYWGMPRRVRLVFEPAEGRLCDLTGATDSVVVSRYRTRNYGVQYSEGFAHPLSPYYAPKKDAVRLPVHPQPGGISYRHWLGLIVSDDGRSFPASAIAAAERRADRLAAFKSIRIAAFGYDMDNMKARGWSQSEMPLIPDGGSMDLDFIEALVRKLVPSAELVSRAVVAQVKAALWDRPSDAPGDYGFVGERFWRDTEAAFLAMLSAGKPDHPDADKPALENWVGTLRRHALDLFDEYAPSDGLEDRDMERLVRARWSLVTTFSGGGALGKDLYGRLGLVTPKEKRLRRDAAEANG